MYKKDKILYIHSNLAWMEEVYLIRILKSVLSIVALLQFIAKTRKGKAMVQTPKVASSTIALFLGEKV
jgi:hypothetical protein